VAGGKGEGGQGSGGWEYHRRKSCGGDADKDHEPFEDRRGGPNWVLMTDATHAVEVV